MLRAIKSGSRTGKPKDLELVKLDLPAPLGPAITRNVAATIIFLA
jgi:hypothetical protein